MQILGNLRTFFWKIYENFCKISFQEVKKQYSQLGKVVKSHFPNQLFLGKFDFAPFPLKLPENWGIF